MHIVDASIVSLLYNYKPADIRQKSLAKDSRRKSLPRHRQPSQTPQRPASLILHSHVTAFSLLPPLCGIGAKLQHTNTLIQKVDSKPRLTPNPAAQSSLSRAEIEGGGERAQITRIALPSRTRRNCCRRRRDRRSCSTVHSR